MKQLECDLCGKPVESESLLASVRERYRIRGVEEICGDCNDTINKQLWKVKLLLSHAEKPLFKRYLARLLLRNRPELGQDTITVSITAPPETTDG